MSAESFQLGREKSLLLLDQPFFGTLAHYLDWIEDRTVETLQTNGVYVKVNPDFMKTLTARERLAVMAHECLHPALLHPYRRGGRDPREWNEACDFAINAQLIDAGFTLPAGVLVDRQFDGMSAEQIYAKRRADKQQPPMQEPEPEEEPDIDEDPEDEEQPGDVNEQDDDAGDSDQDGEGEGEGEGEGDGEGEGEGPLMPGCPTGEFVDGPETAEEKGDQTAADWEVIAAEAAFVASRAGELGEGLARALVQTREPQVDWKAETQAFVTNTIATEQSWSTPNRRLISFGLYFPGDRKENVGPLVIAVDTSGSVTQEMLDAFGVEISGLMREVRPERLHVIYCDAEVQGVDEFTPDDDEVKLTLKGGGGTKFQPVFDWVEEHQIDPLGLFYLTDIEGPAPEIPPYPVCWVKPIYSPYEPPFGQLVVMP